LIGYGSALGLVGACVGPAFVIWGLYQGLMLVLYRRGTQNPEPGTRNLEPGILTHGVRRLALGVLMFHVTCYGWLIFRAESVRQLWAFSRLLVTNLRPAANTVDSLLVPLVEIVVPLLIVHIYQWRKGSELAVFDLPRPVRYALYGAVFYLVLLFGDFEGAQFIYFQF